MAPAPWVVDVIGNRDIIDLLIVGGGINGAGIACDAAGRGLSVLLCEQDDLAAATSSASSKLIHGGLRYLEHFAFRLVREALIEREVLLGKAPHIIRPLRFVLPHNRSMRPAGIISLGLFLYDHLGPHPRLPNSHAIDLASTVEGAPLAGSFVKGFVYPDCQVDDARLVVLNAMAAAAKGAGVCTRTRFLGARRTDGLWQARLLERGSGSGSEYEVRARALVNAAGPWVQEVAGGVLGGGNGHRVRLVKGSHLVVPRLYEGDHAYILQSPDRRVVFVIPYEERFSLIGTTDVPVGNPGQVRMDAAEAGYLCDVVNAYFKTPLAPADAVWSFAGVRPLFDDEAGNPSAVSRDYVLDLEAGTGEAPLLSVFGGKITVYRRLAEHALDQLRPHLPAMGPAWTADYPLPGGDLPGGDFDAHVGRLATAYPALDPATLRRLAKRHGSRAADVLGDAKLMADLGTAFGGGLFAREVDYLMAHEWASSADDILWRRTKAGLHVTHNQHRALAEYVEAGATSYGDSILNRYGDSILNSYSKS